MCPGPGRGGNPYVATRIGMDIEQEAKSKRDVQVEIERAKQKFLNTGRRVIRLSPQQEDPAKGAKPRKQRMKMLA
jgi:hypothetical protein